VDAKVLYWTAALLNLALIVGLASRGVRQIRRGEVASHRRSMLAGAWLVVAFLVSYVFKVAFLGREDLAVWSSLYVNTLRFHETCVLLMLVAGTVALTRARRMRGTRQRTRNPADAPAPESTVRWHHRAGWAGVIGAVAGLASAGVVLYGMYARI
jgi:uncharacterized membrane protein YozB (DUF420 family)